MNQKKNRHFKKTDQNIRDALLQIINENEMPTIAEICRRCRINRSTFYLHYIDIVDLSNQVKTDIYKSFSLVF